MSVIEHEKGKSQPNDLKEQLQEFASIKEKCNGMLSKEIYYELMKRASEALPGNMLELGAAHGAGTVSIARGIKKANSNAILYSFEKCCGGSRDRYGDKETNVRILNDNIEHFDCSSIVKIITDKVGKEALKKRNLPITPPLSLIFIDADGALDRDFLLFYNMLVPGADIIIDDYENKKALNFAVGTTNPLGKEYTTYKFINYFLKKGFIEKRENDFQLSSGHDNTLFFIKPETITEPVEFNEKDFTRIRKNIKWEARMEVLKTTYKSLTQNKQ